MTDVPNSVFAVTESVSAPILLSVQDLTVEYGAVRALNAVSFNVARAEIVTLIGANGAGKTTTLRAISGLLRIRSGRIAFSGTDITGNPAHAIVRRGVYHVPEGRGIFPNLTVQENLDLGAWCRKPGDGDLSERFERVFELFPRLQERRQQNAGTLSGGEQQMLAIGRALMGRPSLLLLDEPSLGLAPQIIERIFGIINDINRAGITVLLVEQNAVQALEIAHRGIVLETGKIVADGPAREILASDVIRKAYLGE